MAGQAGGCGRGHTVFSRCRWPVPAFVLALLLEGCTQMTEPVSTGPDTYMMGLGARGGFRSDTDLLAETLRAAGAYCASQGRWIEVRSVQSSGVQGWTPQGNQVVFSCQDAPARSP